MDLFNHRNPWYQVPSHAQNAGFAAGTEKLPQIYISCMMSSLSKNAGPAVT